MKIAIVPALLAASLAAACSTTEERQEAAAAVEREIAARQGEEVNRICFARQIDSWRALDRRSILLRNGVRDWYKLDLIGSCEPDWAFNAIAVRSRPAASSCLSPGDQIITDDAAVSGTCSISRIYEWDEDAPIPEPQASLRPQAASSGG